MQRDGSYEEVDKVAEENWSYGLSESINSNMGELWRHPQVAEIVKVLSLTAVQYTEENFSQHQMKVHCYKFNRTITAHCEW